MNRARYRLRNGLWQGFFSTQDVRDAAPITLADSSLNALSRTPATAPISVLSSVSSQDLICGGATASIPEPSTHALMIAGLAGLCLVMRRRSNKQARCGSIPV